MTKALMVIPAVIVIVALSFATSALIGFLLGFLFIRLIKLIYTSARYTIIFYAKLFSWIGKVLIKSFGYGLMKCLILAASSAIYFSLIWPAGIKIFNLITTGNYSNLAIPSFLFTIASFCWLFHVCDFSIYLLKKIKSLYSQEHLSERSNPMATKGFFRIYRNFRIIEHIQNAEKITSLLKEFNLVAEIVWDPSFAVVDILAGDTFSLESFSIKKILSRLRSRLEEYEASGVISQRTNQ